MPPDRVIKTHRSTADTLRGAINDALDEFENDYPNGYATNVAVASRSPSYEIKVHGNL